MRESLYYSHYHTSRGQLAKVCSKLRLLETICTVSSKYLAHVQTPYPGTVLTPEVFNVISVGLWQLWTFPIVRTSDNFIAHPRVCSRVHVSNELNYISKFASRQCIHCNTYSPCTFCKLLPWIKIYGFFPLDFCWIVTIVLSFW